MTTRKHLVKQNFVFEKPGDELEGRYLGTETVFFPSGDEGKVHILVNSEGSWQVMGSYQINEAMLQITEGEYMGIRYMGDQKLSNGRQMKLFDVWVEAEG